MHICILRVKIIIHIVTFFKLGHYYLLCVCGMVLHSRFCWYIVINRL